MGCSFCLPRHRDEPAPVESTKSRRTNSSERAPNATNTSGELANPEVQAKPVAQHPDPHLQGKSRQQNDSVTVKCHPTRRGEESAPGKTAESGPTPAYGKKSDYIAQNATNSSEEIANPEPVAKHVHPRGDGRPRVQHGNKAAHNVRNADEEFGTAREISPKPEANHAHPHHLGKSRQQNDNAVEKYRLRRHHRGYHKRRPADDTIYEVTGLRMPETDLSDDVPCRLKTASNQPHSREVAIPPQQQIAANVDP